MNVNQIEIALSQKISASSTNFDLLAASKALQLLRTNGVFVASNYDGLPAAASNEGKIYFIEDIETVVWSNGTDWLRLLDKNTIQFQIWGWGDGGGGRLGDGTTTDKCSPVREISSSTDWCSVSAGFGHNAAIKISGQIWSWGRGLCGRLGDGTTVDKCSPVREISSSTNWCQVATGSYHAAAIKTSGQLWSWGCGNVGQLGDGNDNDRCSPVRELCSDTNWCQVSAGCAHTAAIKTTGQIWSWGCTTCGRLAWVPGALECRRTPIRESSSATDWCQVSAGGSHTAAVKTSGQLWVWGNNNSGRLGDGTVVIRSSPVREFCSATDWCQVSVGITTVAIKTTGELWAWGSNVCGRLGDGTTVTRCSPVREICSATDWCQVSSFNTHTVAVKTSGQIWAWGSNTVSGRLGDGTTIDRCSPVREISSATHWCQVSVGAFHTAAIKIV
jgi:alpha-tubulin suppressor-like RCC1 family protein